MKLIILRFLAFWSCVCLLGIGAGTTSKVQKIFAQGKTISGARQLAANERDIATRFAPLFYQALGDNPRSDFLTNFDFDGDWRGDNNWANAEDREYPLKAYVYYSVVETASHFFVHYAVFHPRDYKGGERKGTILSELLREGAKHGSKYDPTGLMDEVALAHENDLEGCLIVAAKEGKNLARARVVFVETLNHNNFSRYVSDERGAGNFGLVTVEDQHPLLYLEPRGHGIVSFAEGRKQAGKEFLLYKFSGQADDPGANGADFVCRDPANTPCSASVAYDLLPIATTFWARAQGAPNLTYATACDYGGVSVMIQRTAGRAEQEKINVGRVGCAFLGSVGGRNMARPPWAWFDKDERDRALGQWFFDPASTVKRDFKLDDSFATAYLRVPFWAN